jgi:hypothetical protein
MMRIPQMAAIQKTILANLMSAPRQLVLCEISVSSVVNSLFSDGREDNAFYVMNWRRRGASPHLIFRKGSTRSLRERDGRRRPSLHSQNLGTYDADVLTRWPSGKRRYSPPTVKPSIRIVGAATEPRNSRSLAISEMLKKTSFKFPATVISSTGYVSSPLEIQRPDAPRE